MGAALGPSFHQSYIARYYCSLCQRVVQRKVDKSANLLCSCHHLHTNKLLKLPGNPEKHTRILCDGCKHPIGGIGRTSTQTTLASVDTIPSSPQLLESDPNLIALNNNIFAGEPTHTPVLRIDTSGDSGHLSTIAEGVSPAGQSSTLLSRPNSAGPTSRGSASPRQGNQTPQIGLQEQQQQHSIYQREEAARYDSTTENAEANRTGWSNHRKRFRATVSRLRKPRSFTIKYLGVNIKITPSSLASPSEPTARPEPDQSTGQISSLLPGPWNVGQSSSTARQDEPPVAHPAVSDSIQRPTPAHPDPLVGRESTPQDKQERIRTKRRDATLKRRAEQISRCDCPAECHCRNDSVGSNIAIDGRGDSFTRDQVPDHPLGNLLGDNSQSSGSHSSRSQTDTRIPAFAGIGSHFNLESTNSSTDESTIIESTYRLIDRSSQASTYVRSNDSSVSLSSTRPSLQGRSNTMPAPQTRNSRPQSRIRQVQLPNSVSDSATLDPVSRTNSEPTANLPVDREAPVGPALMHASSTSLSNLPGPDDETGIHERGSSTLSTPSSPSPVEHHFERDGEAANTTFDHAEGGNP